MKKTMTKVGGILGISLLLFSCSTDDTPPVINLVSPANGESYARGSDIHFDMEVSDDEKLGNYEIHIHTHDGSAGWEYEKEWSLNGQKNADVHHHEIVIPADAIAGEYHFGVTVKDEAGNAASKEVEILITE